MTAEEMTTLSNNVSKALTVFAEDLVTRQLDYAAGIVRATIRNEIEALAQDEVKQIVKKLLHGRLVVQVKIEG